MTEALALRERLVERIAEGDAKPTVNDVLVKLVRRRARCAIRPSTRRSPASEMHRYATANVGIAVAAPAGLVVPVIRERRAAHDPGDRPRPRRTSSRGHGTGSSRSRTSRTGTFTISNLGMFGVEQFVAVLNPPQVAILAVGAVKAEAVVVEGEIDIAPILRMTLTCDHRAIDGAEGADFLRTLVALVEEPALAL